MSRMDRIAKDVTELVVSATDAPPGLLRVFSRLSDLVQEAYCAGREDAAAEKREQTNGGGA